MSESAYALLGFGIFLFAIATGQAIPNLESSIINFITLGEGTQLMYQMAALLIGFGLSILVMSR